jgi:hypothetical protein
MGLESSLIYIQIPSLNTVLILIKHAQICTLDLITHNKIYYEYKFDAPLYVTYLQSCVSTSFLLDPEIFIKRYRHPKIFLRILLYYTN